MLGHPQVIRGLWATGCKALNFNQAVIVTSPDSKVLTELQYSQLLHCAHLGEKSSAIQTCYNLQI